MCSRLAGACLVVLAALALSGCGQVITLSPTPTPPPTATLMDAMIGATDQPTATPAPYTPAPTPTPTLTPTPIIHTVQTGESLLSVAGQYNISVAALQDANGILDPRTLQIGQQLIVPVREEQEAEDLANSTPTPTPMPMAVESIHFSETSTGGLWVLGEVVNTGDTAVEQVRVGVTLLDSADAEIGTAGSLVALDLVDVGERAPFAILFEQLSGEFEGYRAYLLSAAPAYVGSYYRDLEVRDLQGSGEVYASYTVTGRVFNSGPEEAVEVYVVVTAYDPLNRVIAMRKVEPDHNVAPVGGETTFTVVLAPLGGPVARLEATALGRRLSAVQQ